MTRRLILLAALTAIVISGALATQGGGTAQAKANPTPVIQTSGGTWS